MVKTPTYYVFDMYKGYQDGTVYPVAIDTPTYSKNEWSLGTISASAVMGTDGVLRVALTNVNPDKAQQVSIKLDGTNGKSVTGRILTADKIDAHNTFDKPDMVVPHSFKGAKLKGDELSLTMPSKSIVMLEIR